MHSVSLIVTVPSKIQIAEDFAFKVCAKSLVDQYIPSGMQKLFYNFIFRNLESLR